MSVKKRSKSENIDRLGDLKTLLAKDKLLKTGEIEPITNIVSLQKKVSQTDKEAYLNTIADFIKTFGAEKYIEELMKQDGDKFMLNYARVLEHFLPKLQKTENNLKVDEQIKISFNPPLTVCPHCGEKLYPE